MKRILFVCWGNICRSPAAEGIFKNFTEQENSSEDFFVDSAGTISAHEGERADARMRKAAKSRGIELTSISRKVKSPEDFVNFDLILAMDSKNYRDLCELDPEGQFRSKIKKMTDYSQKYKSTDVPDPYYGGTSGFDTVLDILEDSCKGLFDSLKTN